MEQPIIRPLSASDHERWLLLWAGYLEFYETVLTPAQTDLTWARLLDAGFNMNCLVAEIHGVVVGFAQYVNRNSSWEEFETMYLEDLFVANDIRGNGVGEALIAELVRIGREKKSPRLYWVTNERNATARRLYDRVASKTPYIEYEIELKEN